MDMLKNQIVTISAMQSGKDGNSIMNAIYGIILLSFIEQVFKYLPVIGAFFKKYSEEYIKRRYGSINIVNQIGNIKKELSGSIILERSYLEKDSGQNSEFVEAVLEYISKLPNIKFLKYRTRFFVSHKDEFEIEKNIYGRCLEYIQSIETGELEKITIQVYSYTMDIVQLRTFLNNIHKNYVIAKKNQLGDQTYFFDHITAQNNNIPVLRFDMTPFNTNKSLKTIYGSYMSNVVKRINFFIKNRDWYVKKGIPHTLGLLLHGPPGCGKTSLIKAIANDTHRHIINIQLNKQVTQTQLKSLFFNEEIFVFNKKTGQNELFLIPLEQRIYVMEDVDAISDILYSREIVDKQKDVEDKIKQETYEEAVQNAIKKGYAPPPPPQNTTQDNKEQLTLAFILNLLDGILETPGRIIILTTNHPDKLDSALVRPGRIDLDIHFNRCSRETIVELVTKFYENIDETSKEWCDFLSKLRQLDEYMLTPAEVNKIIFNYYDGPNMAFSEIISDIEKNMKKSIEENNTEGNTKDNTEKDERYERQNKEIYKEPYKMDVVGFSGSNFLGFNSNNFESIDGSNNCENSSSLDDFFKPIV
jgi:energy-coupling factor transporter ATP-binding protein EcfA2